MKNDEKKNDINYLSRWFGSHTVSYIIIGITAFLVLIAVFSIYMSLKNTRNELQSCRSSCSSMAE